MNMIRHKNSFDIGLILLLILLSTAERIQFVGIPVYSLLFIPFIYRGIVSSLRNNNGHLYCDRFEATILLWVAIGLVVSLIHGVGGDYRSIQGLLIDALIIYTIYTYDKDNFDQSVLIGLLCGLFLNIAIGIMEIHINGFHVVTNFNEYYTRIFRNKAVGFQVNANDYCAMMVSYIIGLLYLRRKIIIHNRFFNFIIFGSIGFSVYIIIMDFSRAAIISLFIMIAYILVYKIFGKEKWRIFSIFLLIIGALALYFTNGIESRFSALMDANSDAMRLKTYADTWTFIKNHYFLGVGAGNTTRLLGVSPHNLLFEILSDYGILAAVPVLFIILKLINYQYDKDDGNGYYLIALFGICFLLAGFSVSSLMRNRICWVLFAYFSRQIKEAEVRYRTGNDSRVTVNQEILR